MTDLPISCTLTDTDRNLRRDDLLPGLLARSVEHGATADGYFFRFHETPDALAAILRVIERERQCCRFLRFTLVLEPDLGPIRLQISGPAGTREFLSGLLAPERPEAR